MAARHASNNLIAKRYASALFVVANEQKSKSLPQDMAEQLQALAQATRTHDALAKTLANPTLSVDVLAGIAVGLAKTVKASATLTQFLKVLAENRRLHLLPHVADAYDALLAEAEGRLKVTVLSAQEISAKELNRLRTLLARVTEYTIEADAKRDESLIGGVVVRMGSVQMDASIKGKLEQLRSQLKKIEIA